MLPHTMRAAILEKPLVIGVKEVPVPSPSADEALIEIECIGICGSDIHYYEHGRIGRYTVTKPMILGHELAGTVVQVGPHVQNVSVGDRVAVEPGIPCDRCASCKSGRYNLCPDVRFMATPPVDGAWAEYVTVRSDFLHKLPDSMSFEAGALLEPLSVGVHAMKRASVGPHDTVLVSGLGPVGMLAAMAARMYGAGRIIGSDVIPARRELAMTLGLIAALDPLNPRFADQLRESAGGQDVTTVVETSGSAVALSNAIRHVGFGGKIAVIGLPSSAQIPMDIPMLVDKELDVFGVFRYANTYPVAIRALGTGEYPIERIITQRYNLDDIQVACETARTQKNESVKVMIYPKLRRKSA